MELIGQIEKGGGMGTTGPHNGNFNHPLGFHGVSCISHFRAEIEAAFLFLMNNPSSLCGVFFFFFPISVFEYAFNMSHSVRSQAF